VSAPTEALSSEPNWDRIPGQWRDIRPHGTEARAQRERRYGGKPCADCLAAEASAHAYRRAHGAGVTGSATTHSEALAS
jgi:hypothetical protein